MTIYSDAINNKFLGDCIWANHDINYPNTKYLKAHPYETLSQGLTDLCTQSGLKFRNVLSQATLNLATVPSRILLAFGANSDTIDDRYTIGYGSTGSYTGTCLYNDSGYPKTDNLESSLVLLRISNNNSSNNTFLSSSHNLIPPNNRDYCTFTGVSDGESLAFFTANYQTDRTFFSPNNPYCFYYAGLLADINTNYGYYNANNITKSILMNQNGASTSSNYSVGQIGVAHYIANSSQLCLTTGDAQYPIVCADGQNPTSQWATDMYVFDDDSTLGFPAIGRVRNLLLATGHYTIGRPVKIHANTPTPDAGFNRWLPVGTFAGKTVLMRCYSSVDLP